jgi:hypothetical protein
MAIGISKTFPMDLDLVSRLLQFYGEQPGASPDDIGRAVGLNRPKVDGLNKLMGYLKLQQGRNLTSLGSLILEYDKYLKDLGTLCVFHYLLCANDDAEVWYFASNQFIPDNRHFTRYDFVQAIDEAGIGRGNTRLRADQSLFLNAYTSEEYYALQDLGYLCRLKGACDKYRATAIEIVPALILGFSLYTWRATGTKAQTMSIGNLLSLDGHIGKVFLLRREMLLEKLKKLEARGMLGITHIADLDNVTFAQIDDPLLLLAEYYQEKL